MGIDKADSLLYYTSAVPLGTYTRSNPL